MGRKKFKLPREDNFIKKLSIAIAILLVLIFAGSVYNKSITDSTLKDAAFHTVAMITHADTEKVHESYFYLIISLLGYVTQFYIMYVILEFMLEGKLKNVFSGVKMLNHIKNLKNHAIICGGGRVGKNVALELQKFKIPSVIVEFEKEEAEKLKEKGFIAYNGDALDEKDLEKVGLKKASYVAACLGDDGDNILLVLTAKEHNPHIKVVARSTREKTVNKLKHAGADYIILPEVIGGMQIAHSIIKDTRR